MRISPDRPPEPLLIAIPASCAGSLVFPFAVVEGKSYSTGKSIFQAQNQAAISGACALKMQLDLEDVTSRAAQKSDEPLIFSQPPPFLFFPVCTEGPIHELYGLIILLIWMAREYFLRRF